MKTAQKFAIVLVTVPNLKTARRLAEALLESRLAACVNLVPALESHYWWQSKLEKASEVLLVVKTLRIKLAAVEKLVLSQHPYDTPEILELSIESGTERYLRWLRESVG